MKNSEWYRSARDMIFMICNNGTKRLMYMALLDAAWCLKYGTATEQVEANLWFNEPDHGGLNLYMVCDTLDIRVGDVQHRAAYMLKEHLKDVSNA